MKKSAIVILSLLFIALATNAQEFNYIGVKKCSMCHRSEKQGSQFPIWEASMHAKAYETLKSEAADKIAAEKGYETKAVETEACLKCHATGYNLPAERLEKGFEVADGVQCETCHGPGSEYKSMKIMKDKDAAVKAGLQIWTDDAAIEAMCKNCHNEESPTFKGFNFAEMYQKIKHNIPSE